MLGIGAKRFSQYTKSQEKGTSSNTLLGYFDKVSLHNNNAVETSNEKLFSLDQLARLMKREFQKLREELRELN